jgi:hypothetical protein
MNENPYTPPESEVKDVPYERAVAERPRNVVHAVRMLWVSLVLSIPLSIREYQEAMQELLGYPAGDLVCLAVSMALDLIALVLVFTRPGALWFRRIQR